MPLDFGTLVNAALGGAANYQGGRRIRKKMDEEAERLEAERLRQEAQERRSTELHGSVLDENRAQAEAARALAAQRARAPAERNTPAHQDFRSAVEEFMAKGDSMAEASRKARLLYGRNEDDPPRPTGPVPGTDEYYAHIDRVAGIQARHRSRGDDDDGSAADFRSRRTFMQNRITHWIDEMGLSPEAARAKAEAEYNVAAKASGPFRDVNIGSSASIGRPTTADLLARTVPAGSANAGRRGVKPTVTSSTPKADPTRATSPKASAVKIATDADIDRAIDAVGTDPKKIRKWLSDKGLTAD